MVITLIVDVSASMYDKEESSTKGIREIVKDNPDTRFNLIEFGGRNGVEVVYKKKKAKKLKNYKLKSKGNTPMWDGIGEGLSLIDLDDKNLVVVVTDGEENASITWDGKFVKPLLTAQEKAGVEFLFLGADPKSIEIAKAAGFRGHRIQSFNNSSIGADAAFSLANVTAKAQLSDASGSELDQSILDFVDNDDYLQKTTDD